MEQTTHDVWVRDRSNVDRLYVDTQGEGVDLQQLLLAGVQSLFADMPNGRAKAIVDSFISDLVVERDQAEFQWTAAGALSQDRVLFDMHPEAKVSLAEISRYLTRRLLNDFHGTCPAVELVDCACPKQIISDSTR